MVDRVFRAPRIWSNRELQRFSELFDGSVLNVSGWKDIDKEGSRYKSYFKNAESYFISNFDSDKRGFQGDLETSFSWTLSRLSKRATRPSM